MSKENSLPQSRFISGRSSVLWNVLDPGDPYDIRKSMIARLPEHDRNFMGEHLEIVCLMQAAQIQRLNEYLEEHKVKYRELERKQLDRHYFQVLIKELTQKYEALGPVRLENEKLRDFIKRQAQQLEQRQKTPNIPDHFRLEHEQLLNKYQSVLTEVQSNRESLRESQFTISKLTEENKELRMKYDRLDKQRLTEITQERERFETKIRERIQLEIKQVQQKYANKIYQLESEAKLKKQQLQSKNQEISVLYSECQSYRTSFADRNKEQEQRHEEIQRINSTLVDRISQLQQILTHYQALERQLRTYQQQHKKLEEQKDIYEQKYKEMKENFERLEADNYKNRNNATKIAEYENKIALLSSEMERLTYVQESLRAERDQQKNRRQRLQREYDLKISSYESYESKITSYQSDISQLEKKNRDLERSYYEQRERFEQLRKTTANNNEISNKKIEQYFEELKRLQTIIKTKQEQIYNLETRLRSNQFASTEINQLKLFKKENQALVQRLQTDNSILQAKLRENQAQSSKFRELREELQREVYLSQQLKKQVDLQSRIASAAKQENDNIKLQIKQKADYIERLQRQLRESKSAIDKFQADLHRGYLITAGEMKVQVEKRVEELLRIENEAHEREIKNANEQIMRERSKFNGIVEDLQVRVRNLVEEKRELQQRLIKKDREIDLKLNESHGKIQAEYTLKIQSMTVNLKELREQNERLLQQKNRIRNILQKSERDAADKDREFGDKLRRITDESNQVVKVNEQLMRQNARLRQDLTTSNDKVIQAQRDIQQHTIQVYTAQLNDKDKIISSLERQLKIVREDLKNLQAASQTTNSTVNSYRERLQMVSSELQRLNVILLKKSEQNEAAKNKLKELQTNNERMISSLEDQIRRETRSVVQKELRITLTRQIRFSLEQELKQTMERSLRAQFENQKKFLQKQVRDRTEAEIRVSLQRSLRVSIQSQLRPQIQRELRPNIQKQLRVNIQRQVGQTIERNLRTKIQKQLRTTIQRQIRTTVEKETKQTRYVVEKELRINVERQLRISLEKQLRVAIERDMRSVQQRELRELRMNMQQQLRISIERQLRGNIERQLRAAIERQLRTNIEKEVRERFERQLRPVLERQIRRSLQQNYSINRDKQIEPYMIQINNLNNELRKLNIQLEQKTSDNISLKDILSDRKKELDLCSQQLEVQKQFINSLQSTISTYKADSLQISFLGENLKKYQTEVKNLTSMIHQLEDMNIHTTAERDQLFHTSHDYQKQIRILQERFKTQFGSLDQLKRRSLQQKQIYHEQKRRQIQIIRREFQGESQRLKTIIEQLQIRLRTEEERHAVQIREWSSKITQSSQLSAKYEQIQRKFNQLNIICHELQEKSKLKDLQINQLKTQIRQMDGRASLIPSYELKLNDIIKQLERLNSVLAEKQRQLEHYRGEYEMVHETAQEWEKKYVTLYTNYKREEEVIRRQQQKVIMLENQFDKLNEMLKQARMENQQLRSRLSSEEGLFEKNQQLSIQIDRLNILIIQLKEDLSQTRIRLTDQVALEKRNQQYLAMMVVLFAEIETLRKRVSETQQECQKVRRSSLTPFRVDRGGVRRSLDPRN